MKQIVTNELSLACMLSSKLTLKQSCEAAEMDNSKVKDMECIASKFLMMMDIEDFIPFFKKYYELDYQRVIYLSTILHQANLHYPISKDYQIKFLKLWIKTLEDDGHEVCETTYKELCGLYSLPADESIFFKHVSFAKSDGFIGLKESTSIISGGCTGLRTWPAASYLATWLVQNQEYVKGKSVLELGAGTGLVGFTASKLCDAKKVILSDGNPLVFQRMNDNLILNFSLGTFVTNQSYFKMIEYNDKEIGTLILSWKTIGRMQLENMIRPDVILGSDILFDVDEFYSLLDTFETISNFMQNKCTFLLATEVRNPDTYNKFKDMLRLRHFSHRRMSQLHAGHGYQLERYKSVSMIEVFRTNL